MRASRDLNTLHQLWKNDLGPVAKEHRDVLWARFQEASKVIQAKRQAYQKDMVGAMKENLYSKETSPTCSTDFDLSNGEKVTNPNNFIQACDYLW